MILREFALCEDNQIIIWRSLWIFCCNNDLDNDLPRVGYALFVVPPNSRSLFADQYQDQYVDVLVISGLEIMICSNISIEDQYQDQYQDQYICWVKH